VTELKEVKKVKEGRKEDDTKEGRKELKDGRERM
jgi:hypothetical protein